VEDRVCIEEVCGDLLRGCPQGGSRSGDVSCGTDRRLAAVERPNARHDPDRRHEDRDPDDARGDALVPALAVASVVESFQRERAQLDALHHALEEWANLRHRWPPGFPSMRFVLGG
jgi:hypothetical protein